MFNFIKSKNTVDEKEIIDMLYELAKIETENHDAEMSKQMSWAEVRKKIQERMAKAILR